MAKDSNGIEYQEIDYLVKNASGRTIEFYKGPSYSYQKSGGKLEVNKEITVSGIHKGWYKVNTGTNQWFPVELVQFISSDKTEIRTATPSGPYTKSIAEQTKEDNKFSKNYTKTLSGSMNYKDITGIYGMPYGYGKSVDRPLDDKMDMGWVYSDRIVSKMPLLVLTPCKPDFLAGFSTEQKNAFQQALFSAGSDAVHNASVIKDKILNENSGKYYGTKFCYKEYFEYVNTMLRNAVRYLGLADVKVPEGDIWNKLIYYNWDKNKSSDFKYLFGLNNSIAFYIDSDNEISERFSNTTGESSLAATADGLSDKAKELNFLLGAGGIELDMLQEDGLEPMMDAVDDIFKQYSNPNNIVGRLKEAGATALTGGSLIFPEIWRDSEYTKTYDVRLKLASPDGDNLSIFLNIFVPMYHLLALTLPRQKTINGYASPFLVKGFYKGFFNIDMGIITDLSITKGSEGGWNINGLPTEMEIQFTIKDLYQVLGMSKGNNGVEFLRNTQYLDFMANMAGVNIMKMDLDRTLDYYKYWALNSVADIPNNIFGAMNDALMNKFVYSMTRMFAR